jgi:hypothetical protein
MVKQSLLCDEPLEDDDLLSKHMYWFLIYIIYAFYLVPLLVVVRVTRITIVVFIEPLIIAARLKLTPRCRVLRDNLTGPQLVKKFPEIYGTRRLIFAFTRARHLSLS